MGRSWKVLWLLVVLFAAGVAREARADDHKSAKKPKPALIATFSTTGSLGALLIVGGGILDWHSTQVLRDMHRTAPLAPTLGAFKQQVLLDRAQSDNEHGAAIPMYVAGTVVHVLSGIAMGISIGTSF
jgi:hypothetical protein